METSRPFVRPADVDLDAAPSATTLPPSGVEVRKPQYKPSSHRESLFAKVRRAPPTAGPSWGHFSGHRGLAVNIAERRARHAADRPRVPQRAVR